MVLSFQVSLFHSSFLSLCLTLSLILLWLFHSLFHGSFFQCVMTFFEHVITLSFILSWFFPFIVSHSYCFLSLCHSPFIVSWLFLSGSTIFSRVSVCQVAFPFSAMTFPFVTSKLFLQVYCSRHSQGFAHHCVMAFPLIVSRLCL